MARNALEAVFGALGGGLVGYGKDKNLRMDREEERLARELAARQTADQRKIGLVSAGFEDEGTLRKRPATMRTAGAAAQAIPMSGTIGSALDVASRQMDSNITGGRRVTLSDNTTYVQPRDRTPEGREERAAVAAETAYTRERRDKAADDESTFGRALQLEGVRNPPQPKKGITPGEASTRQLVSRRTAEQFIDAAGGVKSAEDIEKVVNQAMTAYEQNPQTDLTALGISLTRQDFLAAATRRLSGDKSSVQTQRTIELLAQILSGSNP